MGVRVFPKGAGKEGQPLKFKIASWNIRVINNPMKQKEIRSLIDVQRLSLCGVLEVKARKDNLSSICGRCSPVSWSYLDNSGSQE